MMKYFPEELNLLICEIILDYRNDTRRIISEQDAKASKIILWLIDSEFNESFLEGLELPDEKTKQLKDRYLGLSNEDIEKLNNISSTKLQEYKELERVAGHVDSCSESNISNPDLRGSVVRRSPSQEENEKILYKASSQGSLCLSEKRKTQQPNSEGMADNNENNNINRKLELSLCLEQGDALLRGNLDNSSLDLSASQSAIKQEERKQPDTVTPIFRGKFLRITFSN